jgi:hypothetical protein
MNYIVEPKCAEADLDSKTDNLHNLLEYARQENIPVFSHDEVDICDRLRIKRINSDYQAKKYDGDELAKKGFRDCNQDLVEVFATLKDNDVVVVGGSHVWRRETENGDLAFSGCVQYPVGLVEHLEQFYKKDITILLDLRVTLQRGEPKLDESKFYEVFEECEVRHPNPRLRKGRKIRPFNFKPT